LRGQVLSRFVTIINVLFTPSFFHVTRRRLIKLKLFGDMNEKQLLEEYCRDRLINADVGCEVIQLPPIPHDHYCVTAVVKGDLASYIENDLFSSTAYEMATAVSGVALLIEEEQRWFRVTLYYSFAVPTC